MQTKSATRNARVLGVGLSAVAVLMGCTSESDDGVDIPGVSPAETQGSPAGTAEAPTPNTIEATEPLATASEITAPEPTDAPSTTATTSAPPQGPAPESPGTTIAPVFYRQGDEAPEIGVMQLKLITLGYLAQGSSTGLFDAATDAALRQFQKDYALGVDGVFGPLTNRSLTAAANSVDLEPS